jgi:hypothetical protein
MMGATIKTNAGSPLLATFYSVLERKFNRFMNSSWSSSRRLVFAVGSLPNHNARLVRTRVTARHTPLHGRSENRTPNKSSNSSPSIFRPRRLASPAGWNTDHLSHLSHFHGDEKSRPRALLCFNDATTMSVALSNGASVIAFIGLSGEALRGILFIYGIVEDIKDAPGQLRVLYQDLTFFQLSLATFQETATNAARLGALLGLSTMQVLDDAANVIKPILVVFQEYGQGQATPF